VSEGADDGFQRPMSLNPRRSIYRRASGKIVDIVPCFRTDENDVCDKKDFHFVFKKKPPCINNIILVKFDIDGWCLG